MAPQIVGYFRAKAQSTAVLSRGLQTRANKMIRHFSATQMLLNSLNDGTDTVYQQKRVTNRRGHLVNVSRYVRGITAPLAHVDYHERQRPRTATSTKDTTKNEHADEDQGAASSSLPINAAHVQRYMERPTWGAPWLSIARRKLESVKTGSNRRVFLFNRTTNADFYAEKLGEDPVDEAAFLLAQHSVPVVLEHCLPMHNTSSIDDDSRFLSQLPRLLREKCAAWWRAQTGTTHQSRTVLRSCSSTSSHRNSPNSALGCCCLSVSVASTIALNPRIHEDFREVRLQMVPALPLCASLLDPRGPLYFDLHRLYESFTVGSDEITTAVDRRDEATAMSLLLEDGGVEGDGEPIGSFCRGSIAPRLPPVNRQYGRSVDPRLVMATDAWLRAFTPAIVLGQSSASTLFHLQVFASLGAPTTTITEKLIAAAADHWTSYPPSQQTIVLRCIIHISAAHVSRIEGLSAGSDDAGAFVSALVHRAAPPLITKLSQSLPKLLRYAVKRNLWVDMLDVMGTYLLLVGGSIPNPDNVAIASVSAPADLHHDLHSSTASTARDGKPGPRVVFGHPHWRRNGTNASSSSSPTALIRHRHQSKEEALLFLSETDSWAGDMSSVDAGLAAFGNMTFKQALLARYPNAVTADCARTAAFYYFKDTCGIKGSLLEGVFKNLDEKAHSISSSSSSSFSGALSGDRPLVAALAPVLALVGEVLRDLWDTHAPAPIALIHRTACTLWAAGIVSSIAKGLANSSIINGFNMDLAGVLLGQTAPALEAACSLLTVIATSPALKSICGGNANGSPLRLLRDPNAGPDRPSSTPLTPQHRAARDNQAQKKEDGGDLPPVSGGLFRRQRMNKPNGATSTKTNGGATHKPSLPVLAVDLPDSVLDGDLANYFGKPAAEVTAAEAASFLASHAAPALIGALCRLLREVSAPLATATGMMDPSSLEKEPSSDLLHPATMSAPELSVTPATQHNMADAVFHATAMLRLLTKQSDATSPVYAAARINTSNHVVLEKLMNHLSETLGMQNEFEDTEEAYSARTVPHH